jgi:hypothetical protein
MNLISGLTLKRINGCCLFRKVLYISFRTWGNNQYCNHTLLTKQFYRQKSTTNKILQYLSFSLKNQVNCYVLTTKEKHMKFTATTVIKFLMFGSVTLTLYSHSKKPGKGTHLKYRIGSKVLISSKVSSYFHVI